MNKQQLMRIAELVQAMDAMTNDFPVTEGLDINEIMGMYDGNLLAIRYVWEELKTLLFNPPPPSPADGKDVLQ